MERRRLRILVFVVGALLPGLVGSTPGYTQAPEVAEVATKTVKGLEVTLVVAPPLSPDTPTTSPSPRRGATSSW